VSLAGRNQKVCLIAADEWGLDKIERCVFINTGSCKACLKDGQTLRYAFFVFVLASLFWSVFQRTHA
jgi:hypothetical protein